MPKDAVRLPDKRAVQRALRLALEAALAAMTETARLTAEGATHAEARSEGDKDTRATEQSYIARGQAMRAEAIGEDLNRFATASFDDLPDGSPIRPPALVLLESEDGERRVYLLAFFAAGMELEGLGTRVTVVTPSAPVGLALVGRASGDEVELPGRGGRRTWRIEAVR